VTLLLRKKMYNQRSRRELSVALDMEVVGDL
jgi:hypothetical protein